MTPHVVYPQVGAALTQETGVERIKDIISDLDMIHVDCGDPCHDEAPFNPDMLNKVQQTIIYSFNHKSQIVINGIS